MTRRPMTADLTPQAPAAIGCPACRTILNAKAANCTDLWHADNRRAAAEQLAQRFHEAYERLAPDFGYRTREASAKPWAEVPEQNRALMTAVCAELLPGLVAEGRRQAAEAIRQTHDTWAQLGKLPQSYLDGVADAAGIAERVAEGSTE